MTSDLNEAKYCICALTRGYENKFQYGDLIQRNKAITKALQDEYVDYKMVIFHEGNIGEKHQEYIKRKSKNNQIIFRDVGRYFNYVKLESGDVNSIWCHRTALSDSFSDGYKTMCRFWIEGIFQYVQNYDYIVRVDEDCVIKQLPLNRITKRMISSGSYFGTAISLDGEDPDVKVGFDKFIENLYQKNNQPKPDVQSSIPNTNFMIIDNRIIKEPLFSEFVSEAVKTNCIQVNRWGDTILWGAAIVYVFGSYKVEHIKEVEYIHGSFGSGVNCKLNLFEKTVLFLRKSTGYFLQKIG